MSQYNNFIKQNCAPLKASEIEVYDSNNRKVGVIKLDNLQLPDLGEKLYSFGVISDVHIGVSTAEDDLINALDYFDNYGCTHVCCIGDIAQNGKIAQLETYKSIIHDNVHSVMGNHDWWGVPTGQADPITINDWERILNKEHTYYFTQGNDVFIMLSMSSSDANCFTAEQMQWLQEVLEENKDKRCFIFEHLFPYNPNCCGNAYNLYTNDGLWESGTYRETFESLLRQYKNVILFHGHSHIPFEYQTNTTEYPANYDDYYGIHSIHTPGLTSLRKKTDTGYTQDKNGSQGYIVDVYNNHIILKGRDFITSKFLPIANYCLDTLAVYKIATVDISLVDECIVGDVISVARTNNARVNNCKTGSSKK